MEDFTSTNNYEDRLYIDSQSESYLAETAKWAKFLSIVGFVSIGLLVIFALFAGSLVGFMFGGGGGGIMAGMLSFIYIIMAVIYVFPCLYMYRFATKIQMALNSKSQMDLTSSMENLKSLYKFMGIFTAIIIGFYVLIFVFGLISGATSSFLM